MNDIAKFELEDVINFFKTYYSPNNASLVLGGNFETDVAKKLIENYFTSIPKIDVIPQVSAPPQTFNEIKKIVYEDQVQLPRIYLAWHSEKSFDRYDAALDILSDILSATKNSRLQKNLLFDKQIAQDVSAFQYSARLSGSFIIISTAKPNISLDKIKSEILIDIENLVSNGVTEEELLRAKNSIKSTYIYSLQKIDTIVDHINHYNFFLGKPDSFLFDIKRFDDVTEDDVIFAAKNFLHKSYTELQIIPKAK
jgi:zinc protease